MTKLSHGVVALLRENPLLISPMLDEHVRYGEDPPCATVEKAHAWLALDGDLRELTSSAAKHLHSKDTGWFGPAIR